MRGEVFVAGDTTSVQTQGRGWLEWDGAEKFTSGAEWLGYLVSTFFHGMDCTQVPHLITLVLAGDF